MQKFAKNGGRTKREVSVLSYYTINGISAVSALWFFGGWTPMLNVTTHKSYLELS